MEVSRTFDASAHSVGAARRFVAATLSEAGIVGDGVVADALLAVSELATNAVQHARSPFEVRVDLGDAVHIAVRDGSASAPQRYEQPLDIGGRGLVLLDAIARRWGTEPAGAGKWVWCELPLEGRHRSDGTWGPML